MSRHDRFERLLASLHDAMLDEAHWPIASARIDEACGSKGNILISSEGGLGNHAEVFFARVCYRGQRREDFETDYFRVYHHRDERGPRLRQLPDSQIVSVEALYTDEEKRRSVAYNEMLTRSDTGNALHARLDGPHGSRIIWTAADPVDDAGWSSQRVEMVARLLPHIRQYVRVRLALENARAFGSSMAGLLGNTRCGVIQLDPRGQIVATNARADQMLRTSEGLGATKGGCLQARVPAEDARLKHLLACALPRFGGAGVSGSMTLTPSTDAPPRLVLHVSPVSAQRADFRSSRVAAIVLVVEPQKRAVADAELVGEALGLTSAESRVAVMLAEGHTLDEIAIATGRTRETVRGHLKQIFHKNQLSRQVEVVQLVESLSVMPAPRR